MAEPGGVVGLLRRLAGELADESLVIRDIAQVCVTDGARLRQEMGGPGDTRGRAAVVALGLHRWYTAVESLLERVERAFGTLPIGQRWHSELLIGATRELATVRPAIVSASALGPLQELLRFRHFLRHAYAVELDPNKLLERVADLEQVGGSVTDGVAEFVEFLETSAQALHA